MDGTPLELKLRVTLATYPGRVLSRAYLISRIRRKLEQDPAHPRHILPVRGVEYKLTDSSP